MASRAEPFDLQRFTVVRVMHLAIRRAAHLARPTRDLPAFQIHISITTSRLSEALDLIERVKSPPFPHSFRMA